METFNRDIWPDENQPGHPVRREGRVHFKHEETLMRSINYPGLADHVSKHNELLSRLNGIADQIANGTLDLVKWRNFLSAWLLNHIAVTDKALAAFVEAREQEETRAAGL